MKRILLILIRFYGNRISPRKPSCCRFIPTCSQYAYVAIERFGAIRGGFMALWRILRCNPFGKFGHDPVPPRSTAVANKRRYLFYFLILFLCLALS